MKKIMRYLMLGAVALGVLPSSADVFRDVLGYYCGGIDANSDGIADLEEIRDARRVGLSEASSHNITGRFSGNSSMKTLRWETCDVDCPVAGVTLKNQKCMTFTTINTVGGDKYYGLNLPFLTELATDTPNQPMTVLFRYRLPEASANTNASGVAYSSDYGYLCDFGYDGTNKRGFRLGIPNDPANNQLQVYINSGRCKDCPFYTNETYTTRGACWNELALVIPDVGGRGMRMRFFQPGLSAVDWRVGSGNGTPAESQLTVGTVADLVKSFRGKIHMFAVWDRALTNDEIDEAFRSLPQTDGDEFHYRPRKPPLRVGNQAYGNELFAGSDATLVTLSGEGFDARVVPQRFLAGTKLTVEAALSQYERNYNHIVRIGTASSSAAGTVRLSVGDTVVGDLKLKAGAFASALVPASLLAGESVSLSLECLSAETGGLALNYVEMHGAWSMGLKDGSADEFTADQLNQFFVGRRPMESFARGLVSRLTGRRET